MAKEASDDDFSDVGSMGTTTGHTHDHSEEGTKGRPNSKFKREKISTIFSFSENMNSLGFILRNRVFNYCLL